MSSQSSHPSVTTPHNILLRDEASGSEAEILASLGMNCYRLTMQVAGRAVDVLWAHPDFRTGTIRPSSGGIPLLFPFPGRIAGGKFSWDGKDYELPATNNGNAIHGFCHTRPWEVIEQSASSVTARFHAFKIDPSLKELWPADFLLEATYKITGSSLVMDYVATNVDDKPLPCGFGTHPYFRVPLGGASADACIAKTPAAKKWELVDMIPTGRIVDLEDAAALAAGKTFGSMQYDDVFTDLTMPDGQFESELLDPGSKVSMKIRFAAPFRECIVYTPPHREAICIEPYSCVPGAINLATSQDNTGLIVLAPGESFKTRVEVEVTSVG